jgi:hypothetical protein
MINVSPAIGLVGNRDFVLEVHVDWVSSDRLYRTSPMVMVAIALPQKQLECLAYLSFVIC